MGRKRAAAARERSRPGGRLSDGDDVRRLGALLPLARLELDLRTLREGLEALTGDGAVMDEDVLRPLVGGDEAVALAVVEPLDGSASHRKHLPCQIHERAGKRRGANRTRSRSSRGW